MNRSLLSAILLTLTAGCSAEPFTRPPLPKLEHPDARIVQKDFTERSAGKFTTQDSVVIDAPFHDKLAVLGVLQIDRGKGTFELVGLNQLGVELFHLTGDHETSTVRSAIPQLMDQQEVLRSIGQDVGRMFFDLVPPPDANYVVKSDKIIYHQDNLVYEFGGKPIALLEKRKEGFWGNPWRVRYYDYAEAGTHLYPRGIVMDNGHYHYQVVVKNRDWQSD